MRRRTRHLAREGRSLGARQEIALEEGTREGLLRAKEAPRRSIEVVAVDILESETGLT